MSVMRALLWKEWRQVRWDMLVLSAFGIGFAAWGGIEVAMGSERWNDATLVGIACFLLPGAAIVLGATTTAGDKALSFAGARPASATARVVTRLGVRMAALAIVFASSGIAVTIALGARMGSTLAGWAPGRGQGSIVVVLGAWLLCCFASAALASAFASRPLAGALGGAALVAGLTGAGAWLVGSLAENTTVLGMVMGILAITLLAFAALATAQRWSEAPLGARAAGRMIAAGAIAPAALLVAWVLVAPAVAQHHADSVRRECEAMMPDLATISSRHPAQEANSVALAIEKAAEPLGIDMVPRGRGGRQNWTLRPGVASVEGQQELRAWLQGELTAPWGQVSRPPDAVTILLSGGEADLEAIRAILLAGELPRWESGDPAMATSPIPNLLGHMELHRRLLADALAEVDPVSPDAVQRDLEAASRLADSLLRRSDLISQLIGIGMMKQLAVVLRKLPALPPEWEARLDVAPVRARLTDAMLADAASYFWWAKHGDTSSFERGARRSPLATWITGPMDSWACAAIARHQVALAQAIADPARCGPSLVPVPSSRFGRIGDAPAMRLDQLAAQLELTRKVAHVQRLREADPMGAWPAAVPGIEESRCNDLRWKYSGGETFSIVPEGAVVAWLRTGERQPALSYTSP